MDQYALNVGGGRRPGHEYPVPGVELRAFAIGVVQVRQDLGRVQQDDKVLWQESQSVDLELRLGTGRLRLCAYPYVSLVRK